MPTWSCINFRMNFGCIRSVLGSYQNSFRNFWILNYAALSFWFRWQCNSKFRSSKSYSYRILGHFQCSQNSSGSSCSFMLAFECLSSYVSKSRTGFRGLKVKAISKKTDYVEKYWLQVQDMLVGNQRGCKKATICEKYTGCLI